jgi:hypothetical protein
LAHDPPGDVRAQDAHAPSPNILEALVMTYEGPERRRRSRKGELIATRAIAVATGALFLGLLWLGYRVVRAVSGR